MPPKLLRVVHSVSIMAQVYAGHRKKIADMVHLGGDKDGRDGRHKKSFNPRSRDGQSSLLFIVFITTIELLP